MEVDFHTHILPGIDDGSSCVEQSLEMLQLMQRQGITKVVATPHFYANHDSPRRFLARRAAAAERLMAALPQDAPQIYFGAEVHYFEGISDCEVLSELAIGDTKLVLVEMPAAPWRSRMLQELQGIFHKQGLTPVIAHIDRYITPLRTYGIPEELLRLPVLVQANAGFFIHRSTRSMALRMLRSDRIHLLGSDCHNTDTRKPNLGDALKIIRRSVEPEVYAELLRLEEQLLL